MENPDGVDFVSEIFQWFESSPDGFGCVQIAVVDGGQHGLGKIGPDANATGSESVDLKFGQVRDGRLLANSAHDEAGIDHFDESGEVFILCGIFTNNGVFDPRDQSIIDEGGHCFRFEVALEFDVKNSRLAEGLDELAEACSNSGIGGESLHGKNHDGGEVEVF